MISSILLLIAILDDFAKGHLEICISDEMESLTELAVKYPSERTVNASSTTPLYFGLMIALSEDSDYLNTTVTAVQLALDEINSDSDILRGYSLHYTLTVSQVNTACIGSSHQVLHHSVVLFLTRTVGQHLGCFSAVIVHFLLYLANNNLLLTKFLTHNIHFYSQCFESDLADMTITQLFGTPDTCKLGLIEAGCTDGTVSLVRSHWVNNFNIPQVDMFTNKTNNDCH